MSNKEIAERIGRTDETVKIHLKNIFAKLDVTDRTGAVTLAIRRGLLYPDQNPSPARRAISQFLVNRNQEAP